MTKKKPTLLTIAICTYNRSEMLRICLESLMHHTSLAKDFQIMVIDNKSTDTTRRDINLFQEQHPNFSLTYIFEQNQGLSHARNRALKECTTPYIGYLDDDGKATENYIHQALKNIEEKEPDIFGGPIYPFYISEKPEWFKDEYETHFHYPTTGWMDAGGLSGGNMFFKTDKLKALGGFDTELGMKGEKIWYGEETVLFKKAWKKNYSFYYNHDLKALHVVAPFKMHLLYYLYRFYHQGLAAAHANKEKTDTSDINFRNQLTRNIEATNKVFQNVEMALNELKNGTLIKREEQVLVEDVFNLLYHVGKNMGISNQMTTKKESVFKKVSRLNIEWIVNGIKRK
jgi:glucosyl-dolichyl phosphate glucuronosyltransferase